MSQVDCVCTRQDLGFNHQIKLEGFQVDLQPSHLTTRRSSLRRDRLRPVSCRPARSSHCRARRNHPLRGTPFLKVFEGNSPKWREYILENRLASPYLRQFCATKTIVGMDIVEYNPFYDDRGQQTARLVRRTMLSFLTGIAMKKKGMDPAYVHPRVKGDP